MRPGHGLRGRTRRRIRRLPSEASVCPCQGHGSSAGFRTHRRGGSRRDPFLLAVASQPPEGQCFLTAFVPVHRCGAVPDSHRVPSSPHHPAGNRRQGAGYGDRTGLVKCSDCRGRDSNPRPLRPERSASTRLGYRGMCRKRESNPQPPDSRSGASTNWATPAIGTAGLRRAVGGIRTRVLLSGAQGPHLSATAACASAPAGNRTQFTR